MLLAVRAAGPTRLAQGAPGGWHGTVAKIAGPGGSHQGLSLRTGGVDVPLNEHDALGTGAHVVAGPGTRARLDLDDGSVLYLDRGASLTLEAMPRSVRLESGEIVADVARVEAGPVARVTTANAEVTTVATKLALGVLDGGTRVDVLRGDVKVQGKTGAFAAIGAGGHGIVSERGVELAPASDLARRLELAQRLGEAAVRGEEGDAPLGGLGELRARRPGKTEESLRQVALERHAVKVRIVGNVARTEIDETFTNDSDDVLEGLYRFPLPARSQIERLALEVDGALVDGSFVDRAKGAAIFRGALRAATPQAPKPVEEVIWVPGPWRDPALLEWQRGGRFELKIFPIPKRGSRRVVLAYTEIVAPVAGRRRYVYPLPQTSNVSIGSFSFDAQVLGNDTMVPVRAHGYALEPQPIAGGERLSATRNAFVPSGDLEIEYALADSKTDVTAWGFSDAAGATQEHAEGFVALALRPKLPQGDAVRPRDYVIVLDRGRSMFGERFRRASRLATQIVGEMDSSDRVTVLACDVTCTALPGGLRTAGPDAAHDVGVFALEVLPDGATDLVGAVREAARVRPTTEDRDLRVLVLSDGRAGAGYRRGASVALEVQSALSDPRAEVVAVPIGVDADTALLAEVARGGGGVLVPYAPGERLGTAAIDILNASFGRTLRDVEVTLPAGLTDVTPATLAPIRAGSEVVVTARATGERVKGDVVLRGRLGGAPFEARYPVDVALTADSGNAFVPRLFAAARIAEREREATSPALRAELVSLSQRYRVPSRFTSLLVLESEAMFRAFGIDRSAGSSVWTGESLAESSEVASVDAQRESEQGDLLGALAEGKASRDPGDAYMGSDRAAPAATATMAPPMSAPVASKEAAKRRVLSDEEIEVRARTRLPGRFMRRVWHWEASISAGGAAQVSTDKLAAARGALAAAPDERKMAVQLARLLAVAGQDAELGQVIDTWSRRDPLDADALAMRADLVRRRGDRDGALRILGGVAQGLSAPDASTLGLLALAHERAGHGGAACAFRIAAAELSPARDAIARAVACERREGHEASAARWLASLTGAGAREGVDKVLAQLESGPAPRESVAYGDVVLDARWNGGAADLDVTVVDPTGARLSWSGLNKGVRVVDPTSRAHEAVSIARFSPGAYVVELARVSADSGPVSGVLSVRSFGEKRTIPFVVDAASTKVARVQLRLVSTLVEVARPE